jgi:hypothetical protein
MAGEVKTFNPLTDLPAHFCIIMYGPPNSGKSVMLKNMLYDMHARLKFHKTYLFSGTAKDNPEQYSYLPTEDTFTDISNIEVHLSGIISEQEERIQEEKRNSNIRERKNVTNKSHKRSGMQDVRGLSSKRSREGSEEDASAKALDKKRKKSSESKHEGGSRKKRKAEEKGPVSASNILVILDDVVNDSSIRTSNSLNRIAISGRHFGCSVIILSQGVSGSASVPPIVRRNCNAIMVVAQPRAVKERLMLAEEYLTVSNVAGAKRQGLAILASTTAVRYRSLIISLADPSAREYSEYLSTYGPVPWPEPSGMSDFRMGVEEQWPEETDNAVFDMKRAPTSFGVGPVQGRDTGLHMFSF